MSKYVLHGGYVISRYDGQRHYVGPVQLARLYGLNLRDCALIRSEMPGSQYPPDAVHLYPRNDGDYRLPAEGLLSHYPDDLVESDGGET